MTKENEKIEQEQENQDQITDEQNEIFGNVGDDDNAFGLETAPVEDEEQKKEEEETPTGEEDKKEDEQKKEDETPPEDGKKKEDEGKPELSVEEEKELLGYKDEQGQDVAEVVEKLKTLSPTFKELCETRNFKHPEDAFKAYRELEKTNTQTQQFNANIRKNLEQYMTFDEEGNIVDIKKEAIQSQLKPDEQQTHQTPVQGSLIEKPLTPEQTQQFWEALNEDPLTTIASVAQLVVNKVIGQKLQGLEGNLGTLKDSLNPLLERERLFKSVELFDEVAKERVSSGDTRATQFFEHFSADIEREFRRMEPDERRANPKAAIERAYLNVKERKFRELQERLKDQEKKAQKQQQDDADLGGGTGGTGGQTVDPIFANMDSSPESAFFE